VALFIGFVVRVVWYLKHSPLWWRAVRAVLCAPFVETTFLAAYVGGRLRLSFGFDRPISFLLFDWFCAECAADMGGWVGLGWVVVVVGIG
jgi:hypothetical protein